MPTFHRRNGSVKYLPPRRLLQGLRPAVAIPATLFAAILVGAVAFALHKAPATGKWIILDEQESLAPARSPAGESLRADPRFLFERPLERARTPGATRRAAEVAANPEGELFAPAAGRVVSAGADKLVIEHVMGSGRDRRYVRSAIKPGTLGGLKVGAGMRVQRGDWLAEGTDGAWDPLAPEVGALPASQFPAPPIRDPRAESELVVPLSLELGRE